MTTTLKKIIPVCCILFLFASCKDELDKKTEGVWVINQITYNDTALSLSYFLDNLIIFKEDSCIVPSQKYGENENGSWELNKKLTTPILTIKCPNSFFDGQYNVIFDNTNTQQIKAVLQSKTKVIKCTKMI